MSNAGLSPAVPNGKPPARRPRPSRKTLAELRDLLAEAENVLSSTSWWNARFRQAELEYLDRRFADFNLAHPDLDEWPSLGALPVTLATAFNLAWGLITTAVASDRVGA
jgi:hypothetical protein